MSDTKPVQCDVNNCTRTTTTIVTFLNINSGELVRMLCNSHARTLVVASGYTTPGRAA